MKIHDITISNFKNFNGEHNLDLSINSNKQKKIILISGPNGAGKTTILEAVRLCMFGKRFNGNILSNRDYEKYLISVKSRTFHRKNDELFFIQLNVEVDDVFPPYSVTLRREWKINDSRLEKEDFIILRDGIPLEIVPREYWEDYIISLFPAYIVDYFFFDGERVKELATGDNAEKILREAIRDLIGLKLYETLGLDIDSLVRKIKYRNIKLPELKTKIIENENEISLIHEKISEIDIEIEEKDRKITELNEKKQIIETDFRRKTGTQAKEREKNEKLLIKLNEEQGRLDNEIRQICGDVLPFVIASNVCKNLSNQLKKERRLKELMSSRQVLQELKEKLIERIKSSKKFSALPEANLTDIEKIINNIFSEMFEEFDIKSPSGLIHDLTGAEMDRIENLLNNVEEMRKGNIHEILKHREEILLLSKKIKDNLKQTSDEDLVKDYIDKLSSIETEIKVLGNEMESLKNDKKILLERKEKINAIITDLENEIVCIDIDRNKIDICTNIRHAVNEFIDATITSKIEELEQTITILYNQLANKDDMVKEIKIDPKDFTTTLIGYGYEIVDKESISAGEKEIYALSVLWGLSKISNKKFPIIVDTLLSRLDNTHSENVVKNFFPNAGEQVIILAHNREIDDRLYNKLKPYISREYTLSLDETNKIKEGHFGG